MVERMPIERIYVGVYTGMVSYVVLGLDQLVLIFSSVRVFSVFLLLLVLSDCRISESRKKMADRLA